jgi:hypothetical protein
MSLSMCRWENGDCSFVAAPTKDAAIQYLDEIGNAEGADLTAIRDFMVHFELTEEGKLQFQRFGELAESAIFEKAYPLGHGTLCHLPTLARQEKGEDLPAARRR